MILNKVSSFFFDILQVIVFAIAIFLFIYLLVLRPHKIKGASMMPNMPEGEFILTDQVSYKFREAKRGEIIVFKPPIPNSSDEYIKRIIGLPGETVNIYNRSVYINGIKLEEPYLPEGIDTLEGSLFKNSRSVITPPGHYFVLGDNRMSSLDSRAWGFVPKENITGKAWLVYWPPEHARIINVAIAQEIAK